MTWADYAILVILFVSAVLGLMRGFLREVASLLLWVLGFWLAVRYAPAIGSAFRFVKSAENRLWVGYAVVLLATLLVSTVVGLVLQKLVASTEAGAGDRSLGALFGAARGLVIVTALIVLGGMVLVPAPRGWRESKLIPYAAPLVKAARRLAPLPVEFHPLQQAPADLNRINP